VTAAAAGRTDLDQRVVRGGAVVVVEVRTLPTQGMTGLAVAAGGKRLVIGAKRRHQAAVAVMAVRAVGQVSGRIDQHVGMTAGTVIRTGRGHQAAVVRSH